MSKFWHRSTRRKSGFTLVEILIASAVAAIASAAMMSTFVLASRFAGEGFTEARIVNNASMAIEKIGRDLTVAYRQDAVLAANRPAVSNNNTTLTYTIRLSGGGTSRRRLRFDSANATLQQEQFVGGAWSNMTQGAFLEDVDGFSAFMNNTEGFISFVITIRVDMGHAGGEKFYSMVGRSLPRNI